MSIFDKIKEGGLSVSNFFEKWWMKALILPIIVGIILIFVGIIVQRFSTNQGQINNNPQVLINSTSTTNLNMLPFSIFSLSEKMADFSGTSAEEEEFFKKYIGLTTKEEGYVKDVYKISDNKVVVNLKQNLSSSTNEANCIFKPNWTKTILALQKDQKISFYGIVNRYFLRVELNECELR